MHFPCCHRIACKSNVAEGSWGVNEFWTKRGMCSHRGANYVVDCMIEKDADPIKCEIVMQLGTEVLWLQNHALATEGRAWILAGVLLCLSRCHKIAN